MPAVEVQPVVPQKNVENAEVKQVTPQEQPVRKDDANKEHQIRNISAFCDCV